MKINNGNRNPVYFDMKLGAKAEKASVAKNMSAKQFDQLIIAKEQDGMGQNEFFVALKNKLNNEVKAPIEPKKTEQLKMAVVNGSYHVNIQEIARKMTIGL